MDACWEAKAALLVALLTAAVRVVQLKQRYKRATGHSPYIFEGSSPGAAQFGHLRIRRRLEQAAPNKAGDAAQQ